MSEHYEDQTQWVSWSFLIKPVDSIVEAKLVALSCHVQSDDEKADHVLFAAGIGSRSHRVFSTTNSHRQLWSMFYLDNHGFIQFSQDWGLEATLPVFYSLHQKTLKTMSE